MTESDLSLLHDLPGQTFPFVLLLARAGSLCMLLPGIGESEVPGTVRAGIVIALIALLLPGLSPGLPPPPAGVWPLAGMIVAEIVTGLSLGWIVRLLMLALPFAGQIASLAIGIANVLQPDTGAGGQIPVVARLLTLAAPVAILAAGLHAPALAAIAGSYKVIPAGSLLPAADTAEAMTAAVAQFFALGLRLAAPFLFASIVWQVAMALLGRLVPALPVFFVAAPAQILGGLMLLGATGAAILSAWHDSVAAGLRALPGP